MNGIYIIIGGNVGDRVKNLSMAVKGIALQIGEIATQSHIYETAAWGHTEQNAFLNQVLYVHSALTAEQNLIKCLEIEKKMGRVRERKWSERTIDIDILFFNNEIIHQENLKIPHPYIAERRFVLVPLNEIAADYVHPVYKQTVRNLLLNCKDDLAIRQFDNSAI